MSPQTPTPRIHRGCESSSGCMNLFKASMTIEKQSAMRKTALIKAPKTSARANPKVLLSHFLGESCSEEYLIAVNYIYVLASRFKKI
jgi:hypothetical protein